MRTRAACFCGGLPPGEDRRDGARPAPHGRVSGRCGLGHAGGRRSIPVASVVVVLLFLNGLAPLASASLPEFAFELPRGTSFGNTAIAVSQKIEIEAGAFVLGRTAGSFGALACAGARCSETGLERGATTGSIRSLGRVELEDASRVAGDVTTEGRVRVEHDAHIDGTTTPASVW